MRILSQDGTLDLPYENIAISRGYRGDKKEFYIFAHLINCVEMGKMPQKLAIYSTEAKAQKAMEMLREKYKDYARATNKTDFYAFFEYPKVFQFPKDEDVEV